jgi:hypothetical protein
MRGGTSAETTRTEKLHRSLKRRRSDASPLRPPWWLAVMMVVAACSKPVVTELDGEGPLRALKGDEVTVTRGRASVGETYSAGSIPLCRPDGQVITLRNIRAERIFGAVRLEGIAVRTTHWGLPDRPSDPDSHMVGTMVGRPAGLRPAAGYRVPTTCASMEEPVGEVVVTLEKTGQSGGGLNGLDVRYVAGDQLHVAKVAFGFALCGTDRRVSKCEAGSD